MPAAAAADPPPECRYQWLPDASSETGISLQLVCDDDHGGNGTNGSNGNALSARVGNTIVTADQTLKVRSGKVKISVSCLEREDRCIGRVRIAKGKVSFGSARYDLPPYGGSPADRAITIRLSKAARTLLRRSNSKTHAVTVVLRRSDGKSGAGRLPLRP